MSGSSAQAGLVPELVAEAHRFRAVRRQLHRSPELSYHEYETSQLIAEQLRGWGIEVHTGVAGTGVVGVLRRGDGPAIGLRADMDALAVQEANTFAHASRHEGRMHACGHDGHVAMLLAAAWHLARHGCFDGTVHFIFQPAEERGAGACRMIEDGLFERFPCDSVYAIHNWPGLAEGAFSVCPGPMMAGTAGFEIEVSGRSSHAAMPHLGVDAIPVACHVALGLQLLVSRALDPVDTAVLSVTQVHAGTTMNATAEVAVLKGTVRAFSASVFDAIESGMRRVAQQVSGAFGATATLSFKRNYPPVVNDARCTSLAADVMRQTVGAEGVHAAAPTMAAEDFSYMLMARPGCYALLGAGDGDHREPLHGAGPCTLHNGSYDFNDRLLPVGASYWVRLVERLLAPGAAR